MRHYRRETERNKRPLLSYDFTSPPSRLNGGAVGASLSAEGPGQDHQAHGEAMGE